MSDKSAGPCEMNLQVAGDLKINLDFTVSGQKVKLLVSDENGLEIVLDGGAKFSIPVGEAKKDSPGCYGMNELPIDPITRR